MVAVNTTEAVIDLSGDGIPVTTTPEQAAIQDKDQTGQPCQQTAMQTGQELFSVQRDKQKTGHGQKSGHEQKDCHEQKTGHVQNSGLEQKSSHEQKTGQQQKTSQIVHASAVQQVALTTSVKVYELRAITQTLSGHNEASSSRADGNQSSTDSRPRDKRPELHRKASSVRPDEKRARYNFLDNKPLASFSHNLPCDRLKSHTMRPDKPSPRDPFRDITKLDFCTSENLI